MSQPVSFTECCKMQSPCDALCSLRNAELDLLLGKQMRSYQVGEERFTIYQPTLGEIQIAISHYEKLCNLSQGRPSRRRAHVRFGVTRKGCGVCPPSNCRCRS